MRQIIIAGALLAVLVAPGCKQQELTWGEANAALQESVSSAQSEVVAAEVIEISTNFTIGGAVEQAAEELRAFVASQIPCSTATVANAELTIDFGTLADGCTFNGHTYAGIAKIQVERNNNGDVEVTHTWQELTNGVVTLNGGATVTWSLAEGTRHVVHDVVWKDDKREVVASGDRTQRLIDPAAGLLGGIQIDGERNWSSAGKDWDLRIDAVQIRGQDPVPQAGSYVLTTPDDKVLTLSFTRVDSDTIEVKLTGTKKDYTFNVTSTGE
jgi:hypothetical protein